MQQLTLDAQRPVTGGAVGVDDGVHVRAQLRQRHVDTDVHVADEWHPWVLQRAVQGVPHPPHLRVVGRDAVSHRPEGRRQSVDQINGDRDGVLAGQRLGGVDARRTGADDHHPQRSSRGGREGRSRDRHTWHPDPPAGCAPVCSHGGDGLGW